MTAVRVTALDPGDFGVEVEEGAVTTGHRFVVAPTFWEERGVYAVTDDDQPDAVKAAAEFLLEREPGVAIPEVVSFDELADRYGDFIDEVRARIGR
jgi:hypothetical protein